MYIFYVYIFCIIIITSLVNLKTISFFSVMREWSLFALKNILEGNLDNQNFVANIDSVGALDPESSVKLSDISKVATTDDFISDDVMYI